MGIIQWLVLLSGGLLFGHACDKSLIARSPNDLDFCCRIMVDAVHICGQRTGVTEHCIGVGWRPRRLYRMACRARRGGCGMRSRKLGRPPDLRQTGGRAEREAK